MILVRDNNNNAINMLIQSDTIYIENSSLNQQKDKKTNALHKPRWTARFFKGYNI